MRKNLGLLGRENRSALLWILPALTLYAAIVLVPQVLNLAYAFTNYDGFDPAFSWVGAANFFKALTADVDLSEAFVHTVVFAVASLALGLVLQFFLAFKLYHGMAGGGFLKGLFYLPMVISMIILAVLWNGILKYDGMLNALLVGWHLVPERIDWLGDRTLAMASLIFVNAWSYLGYGTIIFLAGFNAIPVELLESAEIDGAAGATRLWKIFVPLLMNSVTVSLFIGLTGAIKIFELPFVLTHGGPAGATTTIALDIYKEAFDNQRFGYSSAVAVLFTLLIGVLTVVQLRITRSREVEY